MPASDGFSLDVGAAQAVTATLTTVGGDYAAAYQAFGDTASVGSGAAVWGSLDANDADGSARDVSDGWAAFADAWGQFIDEGVGAVTKVRHAITGAVADYQRGDTAAAADITSVLGSSDTFDLSGQRALAAPDADVTAAGETARWVQVPPAGPPHTTR